MKKLIRKIKWTFFTMPRHAAEYAAQNEMRITAIFGLIIIFLIMSFLFGSFQTWTIK